MEFGYAEANITFLNLLKTFQKPFQYRKLLHLVLYHHRTLLFIVYITFIRLNSAFLQAYNIKFDLGDLKKKTKTKNIDNSRQQFSELAQK